MTCPVCGSTTAAQKDGTVREHSRPRLIPGGVASSRCPGSGRLAVEPTTPDWIRDAFSEPSEYVCVHRPQCGHSPHISIPRGQEEWVLLTSGMSQSHHKDCIAGLSYVTRDGVKVSPYCVDDNAASMWLQRHQGQSNDWAIKHEGYAIVSVSEATNGETR